MANWSWLIGDTYLYINGYMMIDQLIKKYLREYAQKNNIVLFTEQEVLEQSKSGWKIEILDYKSLKNQRVLNQAHAAGAQSGLAIIATKKRKAITNDALVKSDILDFLKQNDVKNTGYPFDAATHLFILSQVKNKPYRQIWILWAIDKRASGSGINETSTEIKNKLQSSKYYISVSKKIDQLQGLTVMTPEQAETWFAFLEEQKKQLNLKTKLDLPNLNAIRNDVSSDLEDDNLTTQIVTIDWGNIPNRIDITSEDGKTIETNQRYFGFIGKSYRSISPDGESVTYEPINGMQTIGDANSDNLGIYVGDYINGAPSNGTLTWEMGNLFEFTGKLESIIYTKTSDRQSYKFRFINGVAKFRDGTIYNGTWKTGKDYSQENFDTGDLYNKQNQLIGRYKNGKYTPAKSDLEIETNSTENTKKLPDVITYPYEWDTMLGKWTIFNDGNKVYYFNDQSTWTFVDKQDFENKVKLKELITFIPITDEAEQTRLDGLFNKQHKKSSKTKIKPAPTVQKTKYVVVNSNVSKVNLYLLDGNEFKLSVSNASVEAADKTTGFKLKDTKKLPIKNSFNTTQYTMYKIVIGGTNYWIPSRFVTIKER